MKTGKFGNEYRGLVCNRSKGNGASRLICSVDKKPCPYQHYCTKKRIYENVGEYLKCSKYNQK